MEDTHHKCGIFGVYGKNLDVARMTYFGLYALQHRGQESSGISVSNHKKITTHKGLGLVTQVYHDDDFKKLKGSIAIGHNRYSTSGGSHDQHAQPVTSRREDIVSLAHNGNLPVTRSMEKFLNTRGILTQGLNDSEEMHQLIRYFLVKGMKVEDAVKESFPYFTGAFCLLLMTKNKLVAVRDSYGIRPFSFGTVDGGYVFSSETCAIDTIGGKVIRDVKPGEMIVVDSSGYTSYQIAVPNQKLDIFEFVYFSRPDSILLGKRVHEVRRRLGIELAKECKISADVIIPVPDSSIPAALGYSQASGIPIDFGLVKNRYIGRTFIMPDQNMRENEIRMKLNPIRDVIENKRVIILDDSIVRGNTLKKLVKILKDNGAKKVFVLSSCPPVMYPDFYGIDTPTQTELIAANKSIPEIKKFIGADGLCFLSYKGLIKATELPEDVFCTSCFTGNYPIDIGKYKDCIKKPEF